MVLKVNKVNKTIKNKEILKNVSFDVNAGECVALIGPNGAGKTTLFKILLNNINATSGSVTINNLDVSNTKLKHEIAILNQENLVPNNLKVKELIKFFKSIHKNTLTNEQIDNLLNFNEKQKNQLVSSLSGGQKRFLLFVLTLIGQPKILFLDEPTTAMDTSTRKRFWEIINELKENGTTIFYSSHYIEEVEHTADRILFLNHGELIRDTTPFALKAEKLEKYFTVPVKYAELINNLEYVYNVELKQDNVTFITKKATEVWQQLENCGCTIEEIEIQNRTLLTSVFNTTKEGK